MKKYITLIFVLSFGILLSQDDLTEKDFPKIGNSGLYASFQQILKNVDNLGGVDVVWDYSTLTNTQDYKSITWIAISDGTESQKAKYPGATYIEQNNTGIKSDRYFKVDSKSQKFLGFATISQNYKYSTPIDYYLYPMKYGVLNKSSFSYEDTVNGEGVYSIVYDGTGTLKLPNMKYDDVYRLKLQTRTVFPDDKNDTTITNEVQFISRGTGQLLLKLTEIGIGGSQGENLYAFNYYVSPISSVDIQLSNTATIYPNPASNQIHLAIPNNLITNYEITDISGKLISKSDYKETIDISNLTTGNYFIKAVLQSGKTIIKQFVKK